MHYYIKNIFRTFWRNKASYLGSICIIALGIFIFVSMIDVLYNLDDQLQAYYEKNHLAQIFASVDQMPQQDLQQLENIEGIASVDGRLSGNLRLLLPNQDKIISVHALAYSDETRLNKITLLPKAGTISDQMIFIGEKMASVYQFEPLQTITILTSAGEQTFQYGGQAREPEYIYTLPPDGMMPDGSIHDMAAMDKNRLEHLLQKENMVTELGITLQPNYSFQDVQAQLEDQLRPYGLLSLVDRSEQDSYKSMQSEYSQLETLGTVLPAIFMCISIFMLYIILRKMIFQERGRIGTMKAFGFSDKELMLCYLKQSILTGILGGILAGIVAIPFGLLMYNMYLDFFSLPGSGYHNYLSTRLIGLFIGTATSMIATYIGVKEILNILPAEAMRPAEPPIKKHFILPPTLQKILSSQQKMALQAIYQNKFRSSVIALAIAFPFAMVAVLSSFDGLVEQIYYDQFHLIQTYDLKISLENYTTPEDATSAVRQLEGVSFAEPLGTLSVQLQHQNRKEIAALFLLPEQSKVFHIMDISHKEYAPRSDGLILNSKLAEKLHLQVGDIVKIENTYLTMDPVEIPIVSIIEENFGSGCYLLQSGYTHFFGGTPPINAVMLNTFQTDTTVPHILEASNVIGLTDAAQTLQSYRERMSSMIFLVDLFAVFAILAGLILIYNVLGISLRERRNEFGTLSILGASDGEIAKMIGTEQCIHLVLGIILGLPLISWLSRLMEVLVEEDVYTVHVSLSFGNYLFAFVLALCIVISSTFLLIREQLQLDPTILLRERE